MDPLLNGVSTVLRLGHTWFGFILGRPLLITLLIRSWTISFGLVIWSRYSLLWHITWSSPRSRDFLHGYILWLYVARHGFHMHVDILPSTVPLWTSLFWMAHVAKHDASCWAFQKKATFPITDNADKQTANMLKICTKCGFYGHNEPKCRLPDGATSRFNVCLLVDSKQDGGSGNG